MLRNYVSVTRGKKTLFILSLFYQEVPLRLKSFLQGRPGLGSIYQENLICDLTQSMKSESMQYRKMAPVT